MAVSRYFGLPGCGKTTVLTMLALKAIKSEKYKYVYANVRLSIPGVIYVPFDWFGKYNFHDCLLLVDEAMVNCGDRDYKSFGKDKIRAFVEHRHFNMDIVLFSQEPDGIDKKIRSITDRMYYVKKGLITGRWFSSIYKIPYRLLFPENDENAGRILMGYVRPPFLSRLFARRLYRPKYYPFFDTYEVDFTLPEVPGSAVPYELPFDERPIFRSYFRRRKRKNFSLLKYRFSRFLKFMVTFCNHFRSMHKKLRA